MGNQVEFTLATLYHVISIDPHRELIDPTGRPQLFWWITASPSQVTILRLSTSSSVLQLTNPLLHFMESLWAGGDLVLTTNAPPGTEDIACAIRELRSRETEYRLGLPQGCPELNEVAAEWALTGLFRACQYLAYRELPEDQLRADLSRPCPAAPEPAVCYSVDLSFRFLPDIVRLARASSGNDLLLECLHRWATDWPLSSVNIPQLTPGSLEPFLCNPCLLTLYIDRIVAGNDQSRLADERVANAVRTALGGFRELAPAIYDAMQF